MYLCACLYVCTCMRTAEGFSHQLSIKAEKTTLTKLKDMYGLTFWVASFQAAAVPNVPAREVTCGVLSPLGPTLKGMDQLHGGQQAGSRNTLMSLTIYPVPRGASIRTPLLLVSAPTLFGRSH